MAIRIRNWLAGLAMAVAGLNGNAVWAQADAWPSKTINIVITFGAGSGSDISARFFAKSLKEKFNANSVVDIRPGAAGIIGATHVARSAPDGYTVLVGSGTVNAANYPLFGDKVTYAPQSFDVAGMVYVSPAVMFAHKDLAGDSLQQIFASATQRGTRLNCGSGNAVTQVACEMLKRATGADIAGVPYKGNAQSLTDLAAGQISLAFSDMAAAAPFLSRQAVRAVLVPSASRLAALPSVPTSAEMGLKDFEFLSWNGIFLPAGTPAVIVQKLNEAVRHMLSTPEWEKQREATTGMKVSGDLNESRDFVAAEVAKWDRYVKASGVKGSL